MGSDAPTERSSCAYRALWWRVPAFGLMGAVLGAVLPGLLGKVSEGIGSYVATAPGLLFSMFALHPQVVNGQLTFPASALVAMAIVDVATWALLGLAVGVGLAVIWRPRQMQ